MTTTSLRILCVLSLTGTARAWARPDGAAAHRLLETGKLVPLLQEVLRFPTVAGNAGAQAAQKEWLTRTARGFGLEVRDAGPVTEVELGGPAGAPVLGLVVHGDVQPVDESAWTTPPFAGQVKDGAVWGRGAADDKGPLVQSLLAMKALRESKLPLTHTVRLLVGSDEESGSADMRVYLKDHQAPDYSLVIDAFFPVVVGEKAWNALRVSVDPAPVVGKEWSAVDLSAGLSPSIVPDRARLVLQWQQGAPRWEPLLARLKTRRMAPGTRLLTTAAGQSLTLEVQGRAAHSGANIEGGRNALVSLARLVADDLPRGGVADLLRLARLAGEDLRGRGLELPPPDPLWRGYDVNPATVTREAARPTLTINIRRPPPWKASDLQRHLAEVVARFNERERANLKVDPGFFYDDEPLVIDPGSPLVRRLLDVYRRAGPARARAPRPTVTGGASYAKRLPNAIAFGSWFPAHAYPGHDVDEHLPIADLVRGAHILVETLVDVACGPPIRDALRR